MNKPIIVKCLLAIFLLLSQASCIDRETTYNQILGSWEGSNGAENSWCTTYTDDERFHLFSRTPIVNLAALNNKENAEDPIQNPDNSGPSKSASGVSYLAGYWWVARGGRFWQRGALIRDNSGTEYPQDMRVLQHSDPYALQFPNSDSLVLNNIKNKSDRATLKRVENCDHYSKEVNMRFNDPVFIDEKKPASSESLSDEE